MSVDLHGRFVNGADILEFDYDSEIFDESIAVDPQNPAMATRIGLLGINGLPGAKRFRLDGMWIIQPWDWSAGKTVRQGEVCRAVPDDGNLYQATTDGVTDAAQPTWGASTTDNTVTWVQRTGTDVQMLYTCLRWVKDLYNAYFHAGIVKVYLDDERWTFAQCIERGLPSWDGNRLRYEWTSAWEAHDPRWYDETLASTAFAVTPVYAVWVKDHDYTAADEVVPITGNGRAYIADNDGRSGDTEPPWVDDVEDDGTAIPWDSTVTKALNDRVLPLTPNGFYYVCTARAGAFKTGNAEPAWPVADGGTVVDQDITWTARPIITWSDAGAVGAINHVFTVENAGNAPTGPVITLNVPIGTLNITVRNQTTGKQFTITGAPGAAGDLEIDCTEGTVAMGTEDLTSLFDGEMFDLTPGTNTINVTWVEPGPATITIAHRDAWW